MLDQVYYKFVLYIDKCDILITRAQLEQCMSQWQGYNELYDGLTQWLKDTDSKVRTDSGPRGDLDGKRRQLDTFKVYAKVNPECIYNALLFCHISVTVQ